MRGGTVGTVARREIRGYYDQPTAYVLVVAFLGLSLFLAFRTMYAMGVASLRPLFDLLPMLFAVFVPAATMRALAEERRSRTLDWLVAQPLTETELVLGKFLGNWLFVLVTLAGTVPTAIGVLLVSDADPGIMVAQYVGAALLAAQLVALGLWASAVTRNQITAFILAAVASFVLVLIGLPIAQIGLPPAVSGALARLSVVSHFENVARGVIDLRDVLYFVSTAALFLALTAAAMSRDRLSRARPEARRLAVGTATLALLVLVVNLLGSHVRGRLDLTRGNLYTLSPGTRELLEGLDDLVRIRLYASSELPPEIQIQLRDVRDLLADMERTAGGNLRVTEIDPGGSPEAADEAADDGVFPIEFNVLRDDEFQIRRGYYGLVVAYADESEVTPLIERTDDLEFRIASQIHSMTTTERPVVAFARGYGAKTSPELLGVGTRLAERYDVRAVDLAPDSAGAEAAPLDPDSTRVLVVAGPTRHVDSTAVERLEDYLDAGGSLLLLLEPVELNPQMPQPLPVESGLERLLEERGIEPAEGLVVDLASSERVSLGRSGFFNLVTSYPLWPVARPGADHAITRGLNALTLGWATALRVDDARAPETVPLWQTTELGGMRARSASIDPDQEWDLPRAELETRTLAVAQAPEEGGRLVVVGDASFVEPQFAQVNPSNLVFLQNAIDWLARDEALIAIRSKDRTPPVLAFESDLGRTLLKWGNLVGVPLLFVLAGVARVGGRRRRAEARWKEVVA